MAIERPVGGWKFEGVTEHPGEMLREEFLVPLGISADELAAKLRVGASTLNAILDEKRAITPDIALRLARYFGNSAQFWLNVQTMHDLSKAQQDVGAKVDSEVEPYQRAA